MLYALGQGQGRDSAEKLKLQEMMGQSVLPLFGLDNESATCKSLPSSRACSIIRHARCTIYMASSDKALDPFVDLWNTRGSLKRVQDIARVLPDDGQTLHLFRCYRDLGYVIYPGIADPERFEQEVTSFLMSRAAVVSADDGVNEQACHGKSYHWLAVLFAVLGNGAQCSAMPRKERELTSQVYICCSFECLRITNFVSQPHLESIQALLVIGHVTANNMNAGAAWSMLGLTIRLAQGLGIHRNCPPNVPTDIVLPRSKVWWGVMWLDSLLSITYDRAGTIAGCDIDTMPMPQSFASTGPYHCTMYRMSKVSLDIVRDRAIVMEARDHHVRMIEHRDTISAIMRESAEYLRDSRKCISTRETLEHWGKLRRYVGVVQVLIVNDP